MTQSTQDNCIWMTDKWSSPHRRLTFRVILTGHPEILVTQHKALEPPYLASFERLVNVLEAGEKGLPHNPGDVPTAFAPYRNQHIVWKLPEAFNTTDFMIVSEPYAEVFRSVDLGHGAIYPVDLYQFDKTTRIEQGPFFIVVLGCLKNTFEPTPLAESHSTMTYDGINKCYDYHPTILIDDVFCFTPPALEGPDLWQERRIRGGAVFFSDRLRRRFEEAKLKAFNFARCPIV